MSTYKFNTLHEYQIHPTLLRDSLEAINDLRNAGIPIRNAFIATHNSRATDHDPNTLVLYLHIPDHFASPSEAFDAIAPHLNPRLLERLSPYHEGTYAQILLAPQLAPLDFPHFHLVRDSNHLT